MKKSMYDITHLATLYFPDSTERNARRRFLKMLKGERDLWEQLAGLGFGCYRRSLTPRQYDLIIRTLGKPDEAEDFGHWAR